MMMFLDECGLPFIVDHLAGRAIQLAAA